MKALAATDILCIKFFATRVFLNPRTAPVWNITALWDRIFLKQNRVTAHLRIKKSVPQVFWYIEDFHTKLFGTVRQNTLTKPWWPLLCVKISDARILLENRTVLIRNFFVLWDKIFWQNPDALLLCMNVFGTRYFFETRKGSLTNFFGTVKQK